ncbi:NUDIX hydrolase [Actinophytocola gossypii]|uniref:NUDIX hydrolase n=1 Tax=Actinophytocola gossypii TaxID=2812003 RepID=A0ABT2JGV3_9PSEU|nr:NUDIX hydrolase [Actinophytocola gossypii]MCT2586509.1 NUDIX hydrolase [Actinophytocola gossypii]
MPSSSGRPRGARAGRRGRRRGQRQKQRMTSVDETSAGGVVVNTERDRVVLIGRLDRRGRLLWSLPKGHIEEGETPEQTAVREVTEETGILGEIIRPLGTIDYWFVADRRRIHKTVHHFVMTERGGELSDEDIEVTEVAWVPLDELEERLAYADERRLVLRALELLELRPTGDDSGGTSDGAPRDLPAGADGG